MKEQSERDADSPLFHGVESAGEPGKEVMARPVSTMDIIAQVSAMPPDAGDRVALMKELIAMKYADEDRNARLNFEAAFSKMRAELPIIKKNKDVKRSNGDYLYSYAPLEEIQKVCDPILQRYGFSYSWREEAIEVNGKTGKRTHFDLFNFGHTKSNFSDAPGLASTSVMNEAQAARATSSYTKRNSMVDGLGLIIEDEDTDGNLDLTDEELKKTLDAMDSAKTEMELLDASKKAKDKYANKPEAITFIVGKFAECKARLRTPQ